MFCIPMQELNKYPNNRSISFRLEKSKSARSNTFDTSLYIVHI